ncbi:hypothetical protein Tco_0816036 [Tanacetum coccineum]
MRGSYYSFPCSIFSTGKDPKLCNDILMFQQHHGETLSEAWTHFKDLLQKVPHHGIDLWLHVQMFYDHVNPVTRRTIDQSAGGKLRDRNAKESWALLEDLSLYDNEMVPMTLSIAWKILNTHLCVLMKREVLSARSYQSSRSYPNMDPQCSNHIHGSINAIAVHLEKQSESYNDRAKEKEEKEKDSQKLSMPTLPHHPIHQFHSLPKKSSNSIHSSNRSDWFLNPDVVYIKGNDEEVMFIKIIRKNDDSRKEGPEEEGSTTIQGVGVEYFDIFPTRSELAYHKTNEVAYKMPHKIEQYNSLSDLEKEHTKSVYLRNEEDKRRGVEYVMRKILGFYKECLELGPEYLTGMDDEGEVMLYLMRRSLEVLRKFHWITLGGRFNQLSHVSSLLLSKPGEY